VKAVAFLECRCGVFFVRVSVQQGRIQIDGQWMVGVDAVVGGVFTGAAPRRGSGPLLGRNR
jgi:hypothetical protein